MYKGSEVKGKHGKIASNSTTLIQLLEFLCVSSSTFLEKGSSSQTMHKT